MMTDDYKYAVELFKKTMQGIQQPINNHFVSNRNQQHIPNLSIQNQTNINNKDVQCIKSNKHRLSPPPTPPYLKGQSKPPMDLFGMYDPDKEDNCLNLNSTHSASADHFKPDNNNSKVNHSDDNKWDNGDNHSSHHHRNHDRNHHHRSHHRPHHRHHRRHRNYTNTQYNPKMSNMINDNQFNNDIDIDYKHSPPNNRNNTNNVNQSNDIDHSFPPPAYGQYKLPHVSKYQYIPHIPPVAPAQPISHLPYVPYVSHSTPPHLQKKSRPVSSGSAPYKKKKKKRKKKKRPICRYWSNDGCYYGKNCYFQHPDPQIEYIEENEQAEYVEENPIIKYVYRYRPVDKVEHKKAIESAVNSLPIRTLTQFEENKRIGCRICMDLLKKNDQVMTLPCFHQYHRLCIENWFNDNEICPVCRHAVVKLQ